MKREKSGRENFSFRTLRRIFSKRTLTKKFTPPSSYFLEKQKSDKNKNGASKKSDDWSNPKKILRPTGQNYNDSNMNQKSSVPLIDPRQNSTHNNHSTNARMNQTPVKSTIPTQVEQHSSFSQHQQPSKLTLFLQSAEQQNQTPKHLVLSPVNSSPLPSVAIPSAPPSGKPSSNLIEKVDESKLKSSSGHMEVDRSCQEKFQELKFRKKYRYLIFKIINFKLEVEQTGSSKF